MKDELRIQARGNYLEESPLENARGLARTFGSIFPLSLIRNALRVRGHRQHTISSAERLSSRLDC
jgi:hypothetical protein